MMMRLFFFRILFDAYSGSKNKNKTRSSAEAAKARARNERAQSVHVACAAFVRQTKNAHSLAAMTSLEVGRRASSLVSEFESWLEEEEEERMPL